MAIITAAGTTNNWDQRTFNKNGSVVTLKKISETDWLLFGDIAEGDSAGFEESLVCESRTTWDGPGASFGVKNGEPFMATDYVLAIDAYFAYDSEGIKEQTGEFTTPIPDDIEWLVVGDNREGGFIIALKEVEDAPVLSGVNQLTINVTDGVSVETLTAYRNSFHFHAESYGVSFYPEAGKTLCIQVTPTGTP